MSFPPLPPSVDDLPSRRWETFQPYFAELQERPVTAATIRGWLQDWSDVQRLLRECFSITYIAKTINTTDAAKEQAFLDMINEVMPQASIANQALNERLLQLPLDDLDDLNLMLRSIRSEFELFREANVPLQTELQRLSNEYDKITGGMKALWRGEEKNLSQLAVFLEDPDRAVREQAWKTMMSLWLDSRTELNQLFADMLVVREQVATNADMPDYRAYAFRDYQRFDYTPEDCLTFHEAIEAVVVPAAKRLLEKRQARLGLATLRPWDIEVEASDAPPLQPYQGQVELIERGQGIFHQVDPELGRYFDIMAEEELLDLDTRPGKALGGYCDYLPLRQRPFIFMNGAGLHQDVQTLLHEAGHAFHGFAGAHLPLIWQRHSPMEFNEVASMAMELLAAPYLTVDRGGFYSPAEAARARLKHLEEGILFLPYMAVVDAFQHWVYTHPQEAAEAAQCDAAWDALWARYMPMVDWSGHEAARMTGWHRKLHIFQIPFYYVEYGMAQVGAWQVWRNSRQDPAGSLAAYRRALSLGATKTLPELFAAAGAEFRFDTPMLEELVSLVEATIAELEREAETS